METLTIITAGAILVSGTAFALFVGYMCGVIEEQEHVSQMSQGASHGHGA